MSVKEEKLVVNSGLIKKENHELFYATHINFKSNIDINKTMETNINGLACTSRWLPLWTERARCMHSITWHLNRKYRSVNVVDMHTHCWHILY